jgi:UDP-N-acetylmuramyl tripeptide synthase
MTLRSRLAVKAAKLTSSFIKKMNRGSGVTLPGYVARIIDPSILSTMASMTQKKNIVVMGTNGKTTANALLNQVLESEGNKVIFNRTGANMLNGIVASFVLATDNNGNTNADYACIEVDEIASQVVLPFLKPDYILLTNIARDQLDRFGEIDITFQIIKKAFESTSSSTLIINCDDPLSYSLATQCKNPHVTYGICDDIFGDHISDKEDSTESIFCQSCPSDDTDLSPSGKLQYDFFHYGGLGVYQCLNCDFKRPVPDYTATNILRKQELYSFEMDGDKINTLAKATYNLYNTLSAIAVLKASQAIVPHLLETIQGFDFGNNREGVFKIGDSTVQLHLAKNPIGFSQKISLILKDKEQKDIIFIINDTYQDGEDVSWLWDVDFQFFDNENVNSLICSGTRKYDVGLRLKYDDIKCDFSINLKETILGLIAQKSTNIYIVMNYSGLHPTNALLNKLKAEYSTTT